MFHLSTRLAFFRSFTNSLFLRFFFLVLCASAKQDVERPFLSFSACRSLVLHPLSPVVLSLFSERAVPANNDFDIPIRLYFTLPPLLKHVSYSVICQDGFQKVNGCLGCSGFSYACRWRGFNSTLHRLAQKGFADEHGSIQSRPYWYVFNPLLAAISNILPAGVVLGIALIVTFFISIAGVVQRNHVTIGLVITNYALLVDAFGIVIIGTFVWFYTLQERKNFSILWHAATPDDRRELQDMVHYFFSL